MKTGISITYTKGAPVRASGDTPPHRPPPPEPHDLPPEGDLALKTRPKLKKPNMYRVVMLNDDYTPMEFVVMVLKEIFRKSHDEARRIMMHVHQRGVGICGVYTFEVAETKAGQVMALARKNQHPLQLQIEKE